MKLKTTKDADQAMVALSHWFQSQGLEPLDAIIIMAAMIPCIVKTLAKNPDQARAVVKALAAAIEIEGH